LYFFKNWNQLIAERFGTIKLPRVQLKNSGEKFTKELGSLHFFEELEKIGTN
jgi:hypothetical protein